MATRATIEIASCLAMRSFLDYLHRQMLPRQEYVGLLIGAARRQLKQAVVARVAPFQLSSPQFWVLLAVRELPGASLGEVAERQRLDLPTTSRVVTGLVARGLVRLERSAEDRRRASVRLTTSGEALARKLQGVADGVRAAVIEGFSASEQETLRAFLRKVIGNLDRYGQKAETIKAPRRRAVRG
jgi:MarR family transcriptional regulator, organic hydroperoxide resistance regulator